MKPETKPGPSRMLEAIVSLLLPADYREHVVGDLHERYTSPRQYRAEAARTTLAVIWSQFRRTVDPQVLILEALALYTPYVAAIWTLSIEDPMVMLQDIGYFPVALPATVTLVALILVDVYRSPGERPRSDALQQACLCTGIAFLAEGLVSYVDLHLRLPLRVMALGALAGVVLVSAVRAFFPSRNNRPRGVR